MDISPFSVSNGLKTNQITLLIAGTTTLCMGVVIIALFFGHTVLFSHLLYIPIILCSYHYPRRGILFAIAIAVLYTASVAVLSGTGAEVLGTAIARAILFVVIGGVLSFFSFELKAQEEQYRTVIESQKEFICRFLPDGTHVFVNEAYCRYFGIPREEIMGSKFRPKIPREDGKALSDFFDSLTPENPEGTIEHRIIMPDGSVRWQQWNERAVFGPGGRVIEYQSVGRDVTDRREAETALKESEKRFREIADSLPQTVFEIDREGRVLFVNETGFRVFGHTKEEVWSGEIGAMDLLETENTERLRKFISEIMSQEGILTFELTAKRKDGTCFPAITYARPIISDGVATGVRGILVDISDIRGYEAALEESEKLYRTIFENTGTAMLIVGEEGKISLANRECESLFGKPVEVLFGGSILTNVVPEDRETVKRYYLARQSGAEAPAMYEVRLIGKGGKWRDCLLSVDIIPGTTNEVVSIIDRTGKKQGDLLIRVANAINTQIVHTDDPAVLIRKAADECARLSDYYTVSIALLQDGFLTPSGISRPEYRDFDASYLSGPLASKAASLGSEAIDTEFREIDVSIPDDLSHAILFPMRSSGRVHGLLTAYLKTTSVFGEADLDTLQVLADDLAYALEGLEREDQKAAALFQIERNMEDLSILNDHVRNPLQVIVGYCDLEGGDLSVRVREQADEIDGLINTLDQGFLASEKIREYLRKHHDM